MMSRMEVRTVKAERRTSVIVNPSITVDDTTSFGKTSDKGRSLTRLMKLWILAREEGEDRNNKEFEDRFQDLKTVTLSLRVET